MNKAASIRAILGRHALAAAVVAAAAVGSWGARAVAGPDLEGSVHGSLFALAVVICALRLGLSPGLLAAALSALAIEFLFHSPALAFVPNWASAPRFCAFILIALVISALASRRQYAQRSARCAEPGMVAARSIQQKLFPAAAPWIAGFDVAGRALTAEATGGDYYDFIPLRNGRWLIALGDVSGHGFASALLMAETRAYLRAVAQENDDPGRMLTRLNRLLAGDIEPYRFITLFVGILDSRTGDLEYAAAGHSAWLFHAHSVELLDSTGLPLGVDANEEFTSAGPLPLKPGDLLLLTSDGLFEAESSDGRIFGPDHVAQMVLGHRDASAADVIDALDGSVLDFSAKKRLADDTTVVVLKVTRSASDLETTGPSVHFQQLHAGAAIPTPAAS